jgi:hypothetical protein
MDNARVAQGLVDAIGTSLSRGMSKLGLYECAALSLTDRLQLVCEHGTFLHNVASESHVYNLYKLFDFYVEVIIDHNMDKPVITDAISFMHGHRLN